MWHDMFVAGVPLLERVIRAALVYLFALLALRVAGKRELGQFSAFDLVVLLFFSNVLQNSIIGPDVSVTGGVVGAATMLSLNRIVAWVNYRYPVARSFFEGRPAYLIKNRKLVSTNLDHELISVDELMVAAHKVQVFELEKIDDAILEPDGTISIRDIDPDPSDLHMATALRLDDLQAALTRIEDALRDRPGAPARA